MTPELALQKAVRARLVASAALAAEIPAVSILDRNERPNPFPSIIIGEGQAVDEGDTFARRLLRIYFDLHVWKREPSTVGVKTISGLIRAALRDRLQLDPGFHCVDCRVSSARFLRDPSGDVSHAVVTISALVEETD